MQASAMSSDIDFARLREAESFLYREASLLDAGRYDEWVDLFAADGIYWVPSRVGQTDPYNVASIIFEDRPLLEMRVRRLQHPRAYVMLPESRTTHHITNIELLPADGSGADLVVVAALMLAEYRDNSHRNFSGRLRYALKRDGDRLKIRSKRVDLLDCDAAHGPIAVLF